MVLIGLIGFVVSFFFCFGSFVALLLRLFCFLVLLFAAYLLLGRGRNFRIHQVASPIADCPIFLTVQHTAPLFFARTQSSTTSPEIVAEQRHRNNSSKTLGRQQIRGLRAARRLARAAL